VTAGITQSRDVAPVLGHAIGRLDSWLETMRQPGGYGGPVSHWWRSQFRYTGPGVDWRYEGLLAGYSILWEKTTDERWKRRLNVAARDVLAAQAPDGSYQASQFEQNPGSLGTPHEAAASLGLLRALNHLDDPDLALAAVGRSVSNLIATLWDTRGSCFNDSPGAVGRVPNKLATLAALLMELWQVRPDDSLLAYARACLDCVLDYQVADGPLCGGIHQFAPDAAHGDSRFFPYYIARCIPPLVRAAELLDAPRYAVAAAAALRFVRETMNGDGGWPQIIYGNGRRVEFPRWIAAAGDILHAFTALGQPVPESARRRLLAGQSPGGGFRTANGFSPNHGAPRLPDAPDVRDVLPCAGWNDKAFRYLAEELPAHAVVEPVQTADTYRVDIACDGRATFEESSESMTVLDCAGRPLYRWRKSEPWASCTTDIEGLP